MLKDREFIRQDAIDITYPTVAALLMDNWVVSVSEILSNDTFLMPQ